MDPSTATNASRTVSSQRIPPFALKFQLDRTALSREVPPWMAIKTYDSIRDVAQDSLSKRTLHDAIARSGAVVWVAPKEWKISVHSLFELGATSEAEKAIYVISDGTPPAGSKVPEFIGQQQIYPQSRLNDLARRLLTGQ